MIRKMTVLASLIALAACNSTGGPSIKDKLLSFAIYGGAFAPEGSNPRRPEELALLRPKLEEDLLSKAVEYCPQGHIVLEDPSYTLEYIQGRPLVASKMVINCTKDGARPMQRVHVITAGGNIVQAGGKMMAVNVNAAKTRARVELPQGSSELNISTFIMEAAAKEASGCDAVLAPGDDSIGFTNKSAVRLTRGKHFDITLFCDANGPLPKSAFRDVLPGSREQAARFGASPQAGQTYLTYSPHGYQVNFFDANGKSWLWYPGNVRAVPEDWKFVSADICFRHPKNTANPVTGRAGGNFECMPKELLRRTTVAALDGDPFNLATGAVPYRLNKCDAPDAFEFDRSSIGC